ncbi:MAG: response regulator [Alphaproteobacteria bacterium]|jgi:putative two-component system response regulator|nr:response regulator [Alphaproteobacteria bacterium]
MDEKSTILIVDDVSENIDVLVSVLREDYNLSIAKNGKVALDLANNVNPDLILLDIMMPEMDGYEVCTKLKEEDNTRNIPVVFLTALGQNEDEERGLLLGAVDYITKPFEPSLLKVRIKNHLELKNHRDNLEKLVDEKIHEVKKTRDAALASMAFLAEFRDPETGAHVIRTKEYVRSLAEHLRSVYPDELNDQTIEAMYQAAELHDIGKVGVPDSILLKPGRLTDEEMEEMKKHTIYGAEVLRKTEKLLGTKTLFLTTAQQVAECHHEKWDGTGYPKGLKGEEIPLSARLMTLADIYDALMSKRPYKDPIPHDKVVEIITEGDGTGRTKPEHFDPNVLQAFKEINHKFKQILEDHPDEE